MNIMHERREHRRYTIKEGVYAGKYPRMGEVMDISLGGVSYSYLDICDDDDCGAGEFIIYSNDGTCLNIPGQKIISDQAVSRQSNFAKIITRECRVNFEQMSDEQKKSLEFFIKNHKLN